MTTDHEIPTNCRLTIKTPSVNNIRSFLKILRNPLKEPGDLMDDNQTVAFYANKYMKMKLANNK